MLTRDEFAQAALIQLGARGETTAVYDAASFSIWTRPNENSEFSGHSQLDRWYEKYQAAAPQGRCDEAIAEFVEHYFDNLRSAQSADLPNKARLIPLVRSRFDFEVSALRSAVKNQGAPADVMNLLVHQPLAEHLDIYLSEDLPDGYRHLDRHVLDQLGLSWDQALRLALWNLPQIDPGFGLDQPFAQQPQGHWSYIAPPSELFTCWLLFPERIRRLPVKGRHVAFLPKVDRLAITGSEEIEVVNVLAKMTVESLRNSPGRPVTAIPFILEPAGWKPWLPPARHPLYWTIKELHIIARGTMYGPQCKLLKEHYLRAEGDDAPHVAEYTGSEFEPFRGQPILSDWCLWTQWVHTILPRTEAVVLLQLLNPEELNANPNAKEQFGEQITITWKQLVDYLGPRLKKLDYYPERYQVAGDDFPEGDDWNHLKAAGVKLPLEGAPEEPTEPLPKLTPPTAATTSSPAPPAPSQLARPFSPPQESKPPPEPSLWPLAVLALFALTCLGG
ncbi:MAG TPA: hypothetical protein VFV87_06425, partial [Pirellulaceae bacterium]|nr:hypothetical protein [Pirellulaceae bacterium]